MELASLEENIPHSGSPAKGSTDAMRIRHQGKGIEEAQHRSHLYIVSRNTSNKGLV